MLVDLLHMVDVIFDLDMLGLMYLRCKVVLDALSGILQDFLLKKSHA